MNIIPVLDLMDGRVVQAIRGQRERYRPIESVLVAGAQPLAVAHALQEETGCRQFYIADLDAIMGRGDHVETLRELCAGLDAELWVDAAITDVASTRKLLEAGVGRAIVCSEALPDWEALTAIKAAFPEERLLFSIDISQGRVLSPCSFLRGLDPLALLERLREEGWSNFILLTLDQVGTGAGPQWGVIEAARHRFPDLSLIAGGGVRTPQDLAQLAARDVNGVLVATSLHRGWITRQDLLALDLLQR